MDVHRCRFVEYPPSTINAVAFSHPQITKKQETAPLRLAIGRANGDIEIWNPLEAKWLQETIIRGGVDRSIDGLVWIQDPNEQIEGKTFIGKSRLFSIGYTTTVTEWDLENGRPLQQTSGSHAEIWCLAAQPPLKPSPEESSTAAWQGQNLIAGCMDGALVLYSTKDGALTLQKVLTRPSAKKAKIVSVVWKDRFIVVAGCSDSTIRIFDTRTGALLRNMTLGSGPKGGPKETIVWSVKILDSGNIVSGDSTGEIKIWDGKTYTLMQRLKGHSQDVLSLCTHGSTIFSGGMDRKTVVYKRVDKAGRWQAISHRRYHAHDVKTMASFEGKGLSVVVSGGPDASPVVLPMNDYGYENHRALPFLPQEQILQSAPKQRLVMSWWERELYIWKLNRPAQTKSQDAKSQDAEPSRKLVAKILIKGEANITAAALSEDGTLVAISTISDVKIFQLRQRNTGEGEGLKVSKVQVPASFSLGARLLHFSPDSKWLSIIRPNSQIILARMITSTASANITIHTQLSKPSRLDRGITKLWSLGGLGTYERTITQVAFSADSRILAVSDLAGYIDTFVLFGQEDLTQLPPTNNPSSAASSSDSDSDSGSEEESDEKRLAKTKLVFGQQWTRNPVASSLPKIPTTPTVLSFRAVGKPSAQNFTNIHTPPATRHNRKPISHELPTSEDRLFVLTAKNHFFEFEVLKGALSPWSRRNPTAAASESFRIQKDLAKGAFWDVTGGRQRIWVYSFSWMWMFDLSQDLPNADEKELQTIRSLQPHYKKRKREIVIQGRSGAGSAMQPELITTGISRNIQITEHDVSSTEVNIAPPDAMDVDEDEPATQPSSALSLLRRGSTAQKAEMDEATRLARIAAREGEDDEFVHEWDTHKYKPILGMCIIGVSKKPTPQKKPEPVPENETVEEGRNRQVLSQEAAFAAAQAALWKEATMEIVLVERPIWEADLPDRFEGDQEWVKKDYKD